MEIELRQGCLGARAGALPAGNAGAELIAGARGKPAGRRVSDGQSKTAAATAKTLDLGQGIAERLRANLDLANGDEQVTLGGLLKRFGQCLALGFFESDPLALEHHVEHLL